MQSVLTIENLHVRRDKNNLLSSVNWHIKAGEHWIILGANGSGKSSLLKYHYGLTVEPQWVKTLGIASVISTLGSKDCIDRLCAVGLNSVPSWCKPYHVLSNGEQFRARMARMLDHNTSFDEFTSVIDRTVAKSASVAIQRYIRQKEIKGVVFSTCHKDIIEWLQPDWVFDTLTQATLARGCLHPRPPIRIDINPCERSLWKVFSQHHYMSESLSRSCRSWLATWNDIPIGFSSSLPLPSGTVKNAWREHRTVILPDYQGLGIGVRLSDAVAQIHKDDGKNYYSKTAHPRMGTYRDKSTLWRATKHNHKTKGYTNSSMKSWKNRENIFIYSHEYTGKVL
jgi:ABC-type transport system involved in cytochrome c biogenesis ATPase subunit/GNAT superfamily N-acetyltransferase